MPNTDTDTAPAAPTMSGTVIRAISELVPGTLTVHFVRRDVSFEMVGSEAVRILTAHRRGRPGDLTDDIDPETSLLLNGWLTVGLHRALAVSWSPGPDAAKVVENKLRERRNKPADIREAG